MKPINTNSGVLNQDRLPANLDLSSFVNLQTAIKAGQFSRETLVALANHGLACEQGADNALLTWLDNLASIDGGFGRELKVRKEPVTLGELVQETIQPSENSNGLNGPTSLIMTNLFLVKLQEQGLIKSFYHCDGPLRNELNDDSFMARWQSRVLDNLGTDFLIEFSDGEFIPIQLKAQGALKARSRLAFLKCEVEELRKAFPLPDLFLFI